MSSAGTFDTDELRALAVALDVLDPGNAGDWDGDAAAFEASVARGRARLEQRGIATFARDGGAEVDAADAGLLRAFLDPDAVVEAWIVDGSVALRREWYVGREVTVVADPAADADERELSVIDSPAVFTDLAAFLDIRGVDAEGDPLRIDAAAIDDFRGRPAADPAGDAAAPRLMNVTAGWRDRPAPREVQLLDAGDGGLWLVVSVDRDEPSSDDDGIAGPGVDAVDLTPATWAAVVEHLLHVVSPASPPRDGVEPAPEARRVVRSQIRRGSGTTGAEQIPPPSDASDVPDLAPPPESATSP